MFPGPRGAAGILVRALVAGPAPWVDLMDWRAVALPVLRLVVGPMVGVAIRVVQLESLPREP